MARVFQYVRPVNAVLTCVNLESRINPTENGIRIKEEPPDLDYDDLNLWLSDVDDTVESVSNDADYRPSNVVSKENRGYKPRTRSKRGKSSAPRRKRTRVSNKDWDWEEFHLPKKQRLTRATPQNKDDDYLSNKQNKEETHLHNKEEVQLQNQQKNEEEAIYNCDVCFVDFFSEKGLLIHKKLYKDVILCKVCDASFTTHLQLKRHCKVHSSEAKPDLRSRPMCSLCKRKFSDKIRLQMHLFHCHRNLTLPDQVGRKVASTNDALGQVFTDFDKFEETLRIGVTAAKNADEVEKDGCAKDTRTTRSRNALLTMISDFDKFVENIRIEDIIRPGQNDRLDDMCLEDTRIRAPNDKCVEDVGMDDTTICLAKENETCRKEPLIRVTNDVQKLEENIRLENAARRVADDADKTVETTPMEREAVVAEETEAVEEGANGVAPVEKDTNSVTNSAEETEVNASVEDDTNAIAQSRAINNAEEVEGNNAVSVTNNVDEVAERATENPDETQRNESTEATSSRPRRSTVKTQESPSKTTRRHLVASVKSPPKSNSATPVKKKMRQTTLTEFINFSGKSFKENCIKREKIDMSEESFSTGDQDTKNWVPGCTSTPIAQKSSASIAATKITAPNTPLIRMHMNPDAIISLLNDQVKIEPVDQYSPLLGPSSSYNLRKSRRESCSSPFESHNASPSTKPKRTITPKPRIAKLPLEERLRVKYNCKKCSVRLTRCDSASKRMMFSTDRSKSVIPLQLMIENPERNSLNGKEKSGSPKIRIMTLDNCIVVELLDSR